jgi:radical SAM superfamily enzyme YgiQ (UPF0313 family)
MTTAQYSKSPWGLSRKIPPIGLAFIAAALEREGFEVKIIDNYLLGEPLDAIKQTIKETSPKIVGITCSSVTYNECIETAKAVKETIPDCKVVAGGPHPTCMPDSILQHPEIDYVIIGEGEKAFTQLAFNLLRNEEENVRKIPGVAYRHKGRIIKNRHVPIENLDMIPSPAMQLLPMSRYERKIEFLDVEPVDIMNVVRGCPYHCTWCNIRGMFGQKCRAFSPKRIVQDISHLIDHYGTRGIYFIGDNFANDENLVRELCTLLKGAKLDIDWGCDARVDKISRDLLKLMKDAGCRFIWFGVESGSPLILEKIKREVTVKQAINAARLCKQEGIQTAYSFMLGIPGETMKDIEATFKLAKKLNPDWCQFNVFVAYPGCALYEEILREGLYEYMDGFLAYVKTEHFNYKFLLRIQGEYHRKFNNSVSRVFQRFAKKIRKKLER